MSDSVLDWRPAGVICLWTFRNADRNYAGWHTTADRAGCESIIDLCDRLQQVMSPVSRSIPLLSSPHFPVCGIGGPFRQSDYDFVQKLRLTTAPDFAPTHWRMTRKAETLLFEAGADVLTELRYGFAEILRDEGDFCIGPGRGASARADGILWFWWFLPASTA